MSPSTLPLPDSFPPSAPVDAMVSGELSEGAHSTPPPPPPKLTRLATGTAVYPTPRPSSLPNSSSIAFPLSSPPTPTREIPRPPPPPDSEDPLQRYSSASLPLPFQIPFHALPRSPLPLTMPSDSSQLKSPTYLQESSSSSSSSSTADTASSKLSSVHVPPCSPLTSTNDSTVPRPRSVSPPPPATLSSRFQSSDFTTAMRRFMSPSQSHHQPHSESDQSPYPPPPEPPVILPADPPEDLTQPANPSRSRAPYMPFLSNAPPPPDCWIQVETTHGEYRLNVRLPGFTREGITLATKRRRILHVVADSWENGGGHFERRISFGYDADLVQVRAEFDGVMLRIFIPRRISPINWYPSRPGPIGRS